MKNQGKMAIFDSFPDFTPSSDASWCLTAVPLGDRKFNILLPKIEVFQRIL